MSGYDGSITFDTKIDPSGMQTGVKALKPTVTAAFASIRDVMMGPVAAGKAIVGAFKAVAAEVSKLENAWAIQEQAVSLLNSTLKATGADAWTSSKAIQDMASEFQSFTKFGDESVISMQNVLLGFKNIKGDNFKEASLQILNMATVMKMDLTSAAQAVGKALDDPILGIDSLSRQGFKFSKDQKAMLKAMVETGNAAGAQKIILDELATTYGGAAEAAGMTGSAIKERLQNAICDINEEMGRSITNSLAPFRLKFLELAKAIGASAKATNDFKDALKAKDSGTDTVADNLLIEENRLASLRDARKYASGEQLDAVDAAISAQEKLIEALKVQQIAEENAARFRTTSASKEAAIAKDLADKAAFQAKINEARIAIAKDYDSAIKKANREEKEGLISSEAASEARQSALKNQIDALAELIDTEKLGIGATTDLLNAQTAAWVRNQAAIDRSTESAMRNALKKSLYTGASDRARGGTPVATSTGLADSSGPGGSMLFGGELAGMQDALDEFGKELESAAHDWSGVLSEVGTAATDMVGGAFETLGESIVTGTADWTAWGTSALRSLASVLRSLGQQLIAQAALVAVQGVVHLLFGDIAGAAAAAAAAVVALAAAGAAFVGAGMVDAMADQQTTLAKATKEAKAEEEKFATGLAKSNAELKKNKDLLTVAAKASMLYDASLGATIDTISDFYESLQDIGADISDTLVDSLVGGLDNDDFLYALEQYITEAVVKAAVFTDSFAAEVSRIGADLASAIAGGASSSEIGAIKDRLTSLYATASGLAQAATDAVSSAFGSFGVGTINVRGDQLANIHDSEMILPPGISQEARASGIYIGPAGGMDMGSMARSTNPIHITMVGTMDVDGRTLGAIAYEYQDQIAGAAYGA